MTKLQTHRRWKVELQEVLEEVTPRLYVVRTQDGLVRRNETYLRPAGASVSRRPWATGQQQAESTTTLLIVLLRTHLH